MHVDKIIWLIQEGTVVGEISNPAVTGEILEEILK